LTLYVSFSYRRHNFFAEFGTDHFFPPFFLHSEHVLFMLCQTVCRAYLDMTADSVLPWELSYGGYILCLKNRYVVDDFLFPHLPDVDRVRLSFCSSGLSPTHKSLVVVVFEREQKASYSSNTGARFSRRNPDVLPCTVRTSEIDAGCPTLDSPLFQ